MFVQKAVTVRKIIYEDEHIQQLATDGGIGKAILFRRFYEAVTVGTRCLVNTTASELRLGTGGWDIVTGVIGTKNYTVGRNEGHIMKGRYLPHQHSVLCVESEESADHALFLEPFTLEKQVVMLAPLHSMLPVIYCLLNKLAPTLSHAYIVTDQAALPLEISEHVKTIRRDERVTFITTGQAFGGDVETVNLFTALQYAKEKLAAHFIMITVGPGVVGTGTYFGFSSIELVNWIHTVVVLDGRPLVVPRLSSGDRRKRHVGISHHTLTTLKMSRFAKAVVPLPTICCQQEAVFKQQVKEITQCGHEIDWREDERVVELLREALADYPLDIDSMGRRLEDDPLYFIGIATAVFSSLSLQCM